MQDDEAPSSSTNECTLKGKCLLCRLDAPPSITVKNPTWPAIMKVVLFTLAKGIPGKKYFGLKTDIYPFIDSHWDILCTGKASKWHKPMQDALSHGMTLFKSGRGHYGTGFWGLKVYSDPWNCTEDGEELPPKKETKKRKKSEDSPETKRMRAFLMGEARSMMTDVQLMENKLKKIRKDFEIYKVDAANSVSKFNIERQKAHQEVLQYMQYQQRPDTIPPRHQSPSPAPDQGPLPPPRPTIPSINRQ